MSLRRIFYVVGFVVLAALFHVVAYTSAEIASSYHQTGERSEQTNLVSSHILSDE